MAIFRGPLNILPDGGDQGGAVITISILPANIPVEGLIIDVSGLQQPSGQLFGNIAGLTIDAAASNVAAGILSVSFTGGSNLLRIANGGSTQVYKVYGQCRQIVLKNLAWVSGPINIVLWNSTPANELQSSLNVIATGNITIAGTPTVNLSTNSSVTIGHDITNITFLLTGIAPSGGTYTLIGAGIDGTIRSIDISACNVQSFQGAGQLIFSLTNVAVSQQYYQVLCGSTYRMQDTVQVCSLSVLGIPFTGGLKLSIGGSTSVDGTSFAQVTIGYTVP